VASWTVSPTAAEVRCFDCPGVVDSLLSRACLLRSDFRCFSLWTGTPPSHVDHLFTPPDVPGVLRLLRCAKIGSLTHRYRTSEALS
jgi:hypothetical protein